MVKVRLQVQKLSDLPVEMEDKILNMLGIFDHISFCLTDKRRSAKITITDTCTKLVDHCFFAPSPDPWHCCGWPEWKHNFDQLLDNPPPWNWLDEFQQSELLDEFEHAVKGAKTLYRYIKYNKHHFRNINENSECIYMYNICVEFAEFIFDNYLEPNLDELPSAHPDSFLYKARTRLWQLLAILEDMKALVDLQTENPSTN